MTDQAGGAVTDDSPASGGAKQEGTAPTARREVGTRSQIRGSSLLLVGRLGSVGVNILTQVIIARYLTKGDFGAFAYALSIVALVEGGVALGLERAIPRFLPLYEERGQRDRFFGTLLFVVGTILGLGLAVCLFVIGLVGLSGRFVVDDPTAAALLAILILLAPIQALDSVLTDLFAVFASPRTIFVRKYVVAPGLRLLVVVLLALGGLEVSFLALGYVGAGLLGILLYVGLVPGMLRRRGLLDGLKGLRPKVEFRQVLSYTVPLLSTEFVFVLMAAFDATILGFFHGTEAVGAVRVVESAARTNAIVGFSFGVLFVPIASRFHARGAMRESNDLYWQTAVWMAVLSFPVFALTFAFAERVTILLYEERYASSAIYLALLALARYVDAAFGPNGLALRVYSRMKVFVLVNLAAAVFHLVASVLLIPPLGALGAAISVAATYIAYNVMKQLALGRTTPIAAFDRRYGMVYLAIVAMAAALAIVDNVVRPPLELSLVLAAGAVAVVLLAGRRSLRIGEMFPELLRIPGMKMLVR